MKILEFFFGGKMRCDCCQTTDGVKEHGYADAPYYDSCAVAHGYKIYTDEQLRCHCK